MTKKTKTPAGIGEAGVIFGFDPTDTNKVNAIQVNANGAVLVTGITGGGGGGGGSSDTTEATQLLVKTAAQSIDAKTPALVSGAVPVSPNITKGLGVVDANTTRVTLATDSPAVTALTSIDAKTPASPATAQNQDSTNTKIDTTNSKLDTINTTLNAALPAGSNNIGSVSIATLPSLPNGTNSIGKVNPTNFVATLVDEFDTNSLAANWDTTIASGDIVTIDGNAAGASYLVISKNPLAQNTSTSVAMKSAITIPVELSVGPHMSQRTYGQTVALEVVSSDTTSAYTDVAISAIQQATTTLTVTTATAHGLMIGDSFSVYGVSDSRFNYPSLTVATTPTPTQFTATSGSVPLPSVTAGPFASGFIKKRQRLGRAQSGTGLNFDNNVATNGICFVAADNGNIQPSGTIAGNQAINVTTTASVQAINAPYNYAFRPSSQYQLSLTPDRVQWINQSPDNVSTQSTSIFALTQVVPLPTKSYKFRIRAENEAGLTVPVAKIVSMTKTGTTTATVVTDVPHGLTTTDVINIYGASDQVAYANLTAAGPVASVIDSVTFTVVFGTAVTSTVYGGYVARINGNVLMSGLGAIAQAAVSSTVSTAADGKSILTLTGSAAWAGLLIGDYVNVHGLRSVPGTGADLGCDGSWKVRNIVTTSLELEPIGSTVAPANFGSTVSGGAVIKRTDLRLSFVRMFDVDRQRVELFARPSSDVTASAPVVVQNVPAVTVNSGTITTVTGVTTVSTVTGVTTVSSVTSNQLAIPGLVADQASAAITTTTTGGTITPTFGTEYEVNEIVTVVSGTTPTLDLVLQESDDGGTNWFDVWHFPRITAVGQYRSPKLPLKGNRVRVVETITGTTPSFTRSRNRLQGSTSPTAMRQFFDRATIVLTTLNSVTPTWDVSDCRNLQLAINVGAVTTTAPALQLEGTEDGGVTWFAIGTPLTAVASSTVQVTVANIQTQFVRARVSTAGVGVTAGYVKIKGF